MKNLLINIKASILSIIAFGSIARACMRTARVADDVRPSYLKMSDELGTVDQFTLKSLKTIKSAYDLTQPDNCVALDTVYINHLKPK